MRVNMSKKKVLIAVGGTGGHVYPATSLAKELLVMGVKVQFVGGGLSGNKYFDRNRFSFQEITCGFISTKNPFKLFHGMIHVGQGMYESWNILKEFKPDVVVGFGSFYTFPILTAAKLRSIPIILHEQNAFPGRVNRLLSPYASVTAVSIPDAAKHLSGNIVQVEMPLKLKGSFTKEEAREYFQLDPAKKTILVFGGSQGAQAINQTFLAAGVKDFQVIHFTGKKEMTARAKEIYERDGIVSCVKDFEGQMDYAWSAADLAITRSGASTIAEAIEYEVPLIMIPFPQAMDNHQEKNADFMIDTVGGGKKILEKNLQPTILAKTIAEFPLQQMQHAIARYKEQKQPQSLYSVVCNQTKGLT
jgi:UDP-N-acetylglucosamine--N-acetylmuramyl-(pentapeptide) pyrophosphoryl-undecaprenol N-acetylglucosamine transferase